MIAAHSGILFPMSGYLTAVVKTLPFTAGPTQVTDGYQKPVKSFLSQVLLTGTSIKAVSAVKELVYNGACHLDEVILS